VLAVSAFTTFYDPLPDLPIGIDLAALVLPNLGLGLLVGRFWVVSLPLFLAAPWALTGDDGANVFAYRLPALAIGVLAASAAVLVLTGVLIRTGRYRVPAVAGAALLLLGTLPFAWAGYRQLRPLDESGDTQIGNSLFRLSLPGQREEVIRQFGPPRSGGDSIAPIDEDFDEIGGPPFIATPGSTHETLRYRGRSYLISDDRIYGLLVTDEEAETEGVGVGDNLGVAEDRYRDIECGTARAGEYRTFPYCVATLGPRAFIWFGQDPIRSILLTETEVGPG
jgi:hypothetical protein